MGLLDGKRLLITGVLSDSSLAFGVADLAQREGAEVVLTGVGTAMKNTQRAARKLSVEPEVLELDVTNAEHLVAVREHLAERWGRVDGALHSIGFAPASELAGRFLDTSRGGFQVTLSVSCYSLIAAAQRIAPLMTDGGSILTLTYLGSDRAFPKYNVMGVAKAALESSVRYLAYDLGPQRIRVNAISAGPVKTAAARGIPGFADMYGAMLERAPLKSDFGATQVATTAVFLASDAAASITAETIFVDNGYHAMGM